MPIDAWADVALLKAAWRLKALVKINPVCKTRISPAPLISQDRFAEMQRVTLTHPSRLECCLLFKKCPQLCRLGLPVMDREVGGLNLSAVG